MLFIRKLVFSTNAQADILDFQAKMKAAQIPVDVAISSNRHGLQRFRDIKTAQAQNYAASYEKISDKTSVMYKVYVNPKHYDEALKLSGRRPELAEMMTAEPIERGFISVLIALGSYVLIHFIVNLLFKTGFDSAYFFSLDAIRESLYWWLPFATLTTLLMLAFWEKTKFYANIVRLILMMSCFALFSFGLLMLLRQFTLVWWPGIFLLLVSYILARQVALRLTKTEIRNA